MPERRVRNLYVIRLDDAVLQERKFLAMNPDYRLRPIAFFRKPCVYVGVTSHDPVVRFEQQKAGYKASRIARKYGKKLMRGEYQYLNPVSAAEAENWERDLAAALRRKGYGVWQH